MICRNCGNMVLPKDGHIIDGEFYCNECTVQCECCEEYILKDDAIELHNGNFVCESCRENEYYCCDDCGEFFHVDDLTWIEDGQSYVCDKCLEDNYYKCEHCHNYFSFRSVMETYDDNWVCNSCRERCYYICDDCGRAVHDDESHYNEVDECDYCPNCYESHPNAIYNYHNYDCFGRRSTSEEDETEEYFGFELEVSGNTSFASEFCKITPDVVLMNDSSIKDGGFEIVTQPMTRKYFKEEFKHNFEKGLNFLNENEFTGHNKGGMHIHISAKVLSKRQLAQMAEILYGDEEDRDIWLCLSQRHQDEMENWSSMTNKEFSFEEIANNTDLDMPYISKDRYTALNRDTRTKTYEIRIFNSNTRIERVIKNMECVFALVDYTKQEEKSVYKSNTKGFINFVKEHKLEYPYFYAFLLEKKVEERFGIEFTKQELEAA